MRSWVEGRRWRRWNGVLLRVSAVKKERRGGRTDESMAEVLYSEGGIRSAGIFQLRRRRVSGNGRGGENGLVEETAFLFIFYAPGAASFPFQESRELVEDVESEGDGASCSEGSPDVFDCVGVSCTLCERRDGSSRARWAERTGSDTTQRGVVARAMERELEQPFERGKRARHKDPRERHERLSAPRPASARRPPR